MIPQDTPPPVHIIGASGRSGLALVQSLLADGIPVVPVVRNAARWRASGVAIAPRLADLADPAALGAALADAGRIVNTAHARHAALVLAAAPPAARVVLLGSTRKFSRFPDAHGEGVRRGEAALFAAGRPGVILHSTMIYGAAGEQNVQRLAALMRRTPLLPLPGGGRNLVQPIYQADVTRAIRAALEIGWTGPEALVIAGPEPITYAAFARAIAAAAGLPRPRILPVPAWLLLLLARASRRLPALLHRGLPQVDPAEIRRLLEDKAFDIAPMRARLGVQPISLADGLARTFAAANTGS